MTGWLSNTFVQLEDYLVSGGVVMFPQVGLCLVMWFLIIDRVLFFKRLQRRKMSLPKALEHIRENRRPDPQQYQGIIAIMLADFLRQRKNIGRDAWIIDELVLKYSRRMTAYLPLIGVLAAVAPLLGLLGTVTGMMTTFDVLALFGTGNAGALANGISEALITTQSGLLIAIPGLYMKGFLQRRAAAERQRLVLAGYCFKRHLD